MFGTYASFLYVLWLLFLIIWPTTRLTRPCFFNPFKITCFLSKPYKPGLTCLPHLGIYTPKACVDPSDHHDLKTTFCGIGQSMNASSVWHSSQLVGNPARGQATLHIILKGKLGGGKWHNLCDQLMWPLHIAFGPWDHP